MIIGSYARGLRLSTLRWFSSKSTALGPPVILKDNVWRSFDQCVGNTSLIYLKEASKLTGCDIYGKAEYENPGGSVKDRAALYIIKDAEEKGLLVPGKPGVVVEGTAGNTGIGLSHVAFSRGYKTIICIADTQSKEKKDMLRWAGATLVEVPAVPYSNPNNYVHVAKRVAAKLPGAVYANQWDNLANRQAHIETTGPEIWAQTGGKIDAFSCAIGTGGTLCGVGAFLRSKNPNIKIALTDPKGAALYNYYTKGELKSEGTSITEGIGQGRITGNLAADDFRPDLCYELSDEESLPVLYNLMQNEGLAMGTSSAVNIAGAMRVAQELGPGHTIVTVLCDLGSRYASKLYNPQFLRTRNLPVPPWLANDETGDGQDSVGADLLSSVME